MKILIDMNLSPRWGLSLREAGVDARHWSEIGPAKAPDTEIFAYAAENDFVILTHDLDFGAILAAGRGEKPSVIQLRGLDLRPEVAAPVVIAALNQTAQELQAGALVTLDARKTRLRILPLTPAAT